MLGCALGKVNRARNLKATQTSCWANTGQVVKQSVWGAVGTLRRAPVQPNIQAEENQEVGWSEKQLKKRRKGFQAEGTAHAKVLRKHRTFEEPEEFVVECRGTETLQRDARFKW